MKHYTKFLALVMVLLFTAAAVMGCTAKQPAEPQAAAPAPAATEAPAAEAPAEASASTAQWPSGPVTIVVPSKAGGFADIHARILADYLQRKTGVAFAVVNNADGGGTAGAEVVRSADPDGLTLQYMHTSFQINCYTGLYDADPDVDFTCISPVANGGNNALVVSAKSPWNTLDELVADARNRPEEIIWGSMVGATSHFIMALLEENAGIKFKLVDAGSEAEKITAILGGHIDICNVGMANADQYTKSGDMRVLGVLGTERDVAFPDYPTTVEQGYDVVWNGDFSLYGPAGMPDEMVAQINDILDDYGTVDEASKDALAKQGAFVVPRTTEESLALMHETNAELKKLVEDLGL